MQEDRRGARRGSGVGAILRTIWGYLRAAIYGLLVIGLGLALLLMLLSLAGLLSGGIMWVELLLSMVGAFVFYQVMMGAKYGTGGDRREGS